jgi:sugar phosphate isomerase/epimerase
LPPPARRRSCDQVECRTGDRVGVDAEVAVEILHVAGLPEVLHAEAGDRRAVDVAEERERAGMEDLKRAIDLLRRSGRVTGTKTLTVLGTS